MTNRHPACLLTLLRVFALLWLASGCAMIREGNPVTTPKTGPGTDYPCGVHGMKCPDARSTGETCCSYGVCARDDEGPYCDYTLPEDMSDPTTFGFRPKRGARSAP